jgi:hypothetical protein
MKILSCDPGIKNLSYCYLDIIDNKPKIIDWNTLCVIDNNENCSKMLIDDIVNAVLISLNENFGDKFEADIVLIENQPMLKNGVMKTISVVIYTYFNMMRLQYGNIQEVKFISATNKLKCKKGQNIIIKKDTYKDRKKNSIELVKLYITELFPEKVEWFNKLKKQDDASDCCLQAIYYIEKVLKFL